MSDPASNPIREALDHPADAPQMAQPGDIGPDMEQYERPPFPPGGPVQPLGIMSGLDGSQKCYYLDGNKQLVALEAGNRHGKNSLIALYGSKSDWLEANWPQWSAPKKARGDNGQWEEIEPARIIGFDQSKSSRAHIEACAAKGLFSAADKMRGRGAHRKRGGGLVLHCGGQLYVSEHRVDERIKGWRWIDCGFHDGFVYPGAEAIPRPWHEPAGVKPARDLVALVRTWNWKRENLDVRLLLGAIGASMIGGWLRWRPNVWITGGRGTGKSTLNGEDGVLHRMFGEGLFRTGNASAAAIRQTLKNSTVPVLFDEIEAGADNRRVNEVIELARVASSGEKAHRGSADGVAQEFTLRSCFWFSSINIPPLQPQDRSRLGILELKPFHEGAVPPVLDDLHLGELGRKLHRRMLDELWRMEATKAKYHAALSDAGHDARACDQFGTMLACADLLLQDWKAEGQADGLPDDEELAHWATLCRPERMAEISEATPDHEACMIHLLTTQVQARGGDERESLGTWIGNAVAAEIEPLYKQDGVAPGEERTLKRLQQYGLKLVNPVWKPEERDTRGKLVRSAAWGARSFDCSEPIFLAVAGKHQALDKIFEGAIWQGGVWRQSLARTALRGDTWTLDAIDGVKIKFGHASQRAVLVPLAAVLDESELPAASQPEAAAEWMRAQRKGAEA